MSIKPRYSRKIFAGLKKYELRRFTGTTIVEGSKIIVYESGHVKAIVGEFTAGKVFEGDYNTLRRMLSKHIGRGIDREDLKYIEGARRAMAIQVLNPTLYNIKVKLNQLRNIIPGFMPPISFRRLYPGEPLVKLLIEKVSRKY